MQVVQPNATNSIVMPIIIFTLLTIAIIGFSVVSPPLNWAKVPAVILLILSLIVPILVAPIITYIQVNQYQNTDTDPNVYSISDLIGMQTQQGSFIGDLLPEDNFNLWVDNSYIFTNTLKNNTKELSEKSIYKSEWMKVKAEQRDQAKIDLQRLICKD